MITENAAKLAAKEYRRRHPKKGYPWWAQLFLVPFWLAIAVAAAGAIWLALRDTWHTNRGYAFASGLVTGCALFGLLPMPRVYVFAHEMSHWLAAKMTFHATGKFEMKATKGFVEIPEPTAFIALAPYILPFYFLLSACVTVFLAAALTEAPEWLWIVIAGWLGMTYAYHLVLNLMALRRGQKDLDFCGKVLSCCIILAGNLVILAIAAWAYHAVIKNPFG